MANQEQALAYPFWRKGQDSNLRRFPSLVFKTSAINHSATLPFTNYNIFESILNPANFSFIYYALLVFIRNNRFAR